ncbi:MAG: hypothetical protein Q9164_002459 [Protoblastenia rupestris]
MAAPPPSISLPELPILAFGTGGPPSTSSAPLPNQTSEALKDVIFGSIAGCIGKTIEYPFDTVKVRLQSQSLHSPVYSGPVDCFKQSIRADGVIRGLYRGISAPLVGAAVETSSLFFSYRIAQDVLLGTFYEGTAGRKALPMGALLTCGAISGAFTSLLLTPIELVKCQMQVPLEAGSARGSGALLIIGNVFRHHGMLGFWHGQLGTLIRETGGSAAWFGSYEGVSGLFQKYNGRGIASSGSSATLPAADRAPPPLPIYQQLLAGATAGVAYNFVFFPADTIKSRMQTEELGSIKPSIRASQSSTTGDTATKGSVTAALDGGQVPASQRQTFWSSGKSLWQQQGLRGMYRGCGITVGRAAPSSAFIFAVYEGLRGWWG